MTIGTGNSPSHLPPDSIPLIDLRFLSQPELNSLSLCSEKAFDLRRCDDVVIPKIDRSVFNESAGSRKQTYSRLRLAPRKPEISAVGRGRYNPVSKPHSNPVDDPERKENKEIVSLLRGLFGKDSGIQFKEKILEIVSEINEFVHEEELTLPIVAMPAQTAQVPLFGVSSNGGVKRKRGRPRKEVAILEPNPPKPKVKKVENDDFYENVPSEENVVMEIVNKNGVVVDLAALACSEDPYGPELRKRSVGLTTEEELLAFLRELNGQWGSRRKKRKVVDASDFGDALPLGWKLLISLKRKEGRLSLYCRRYISPTGHQFVSCKEVSSYLLPFFGFQDEDHPNTFQSDESDNEANKLSSGTSAGLAHKDDSTKDEMIYYEASPVGSFSSEHEKKLALLGTENLAEVEIRDLLECHICKTSFDEKDAYLQHLLSSHQKNTKRARHSHPSVCDGVIIRDGKFECQFCHKIFDERHRYNGHVGNHVRNYVRRREQPLGGTTMPNNVKPSSASGVLQAFSGEEASTDIHKGLVPLSSVPSNETTMQNDVKPSSVTNVLPGLSRVEASDDIDKGSVSPPSALSDERTMQNSIKPSSVSEGLPWSSGVEQSVDKGSVTLTCIPSNETTLQNNDKPSLVSGLLPGFSSVEALAAIEKSSVPLTSIPSNETTILNNVKPSSVSGLLQGLCVVEASADVDKDSVPPTLPKRCSPVHETPANVNSGEGQMYAALPTSIPSNEINTDSPYGKMDADSNFDVSTAKPNSEQNSPHSNSNTGICIPQSFRGNHIVENVDSPDDNLRSGAIPENFTFTSNFELSAGSPCSKQDIGAKNIDETFGGASGDKQDSDIEMTDGGASGDENDNDTEMTDNKSGSVDKTDFNLNVDLRSCLDSTTDLFNNVEDGIPETFERKNVFTTSTTDGKLGRVDQTNNDLDSDFKAFLGTATASGNNVENGTNVTYEGHNVFGGTAVTSTTDGKLGKVDQTNNDLDGDFKSFLGTATASGNNVQNGTNVTYEEHNVFGGSAVGMNLSCLRQGESSFSFSFAPSGSVKANGVGICTDEVFSLSMKMPEHDKGKEYGFNLQERCFGTNTSLANEDSLIESTGIADKEPILHRLIADVSSPLLQPSGCFPTLDLFSTKGQGESESFPFQKFDSMSGFEELGFDDLEPSKFGFVTGKESSSLTQEHMDLGYDSVLEEALNTSVQFEWESVLPKMNSNHQQTAICVWCRLPFIHEAINLEMQSDSVGFMCPTCKAKISGQLNVFGQ